MRYFTEQLWSQINNESGDISKQADTTCEEHRKEYWGRFEKSVRNRLPKVVSEFHVKVGLHDSQLIKIEISQGVYGKKYPVTVSIDLQMDGAKWTIQYKNVQKISFNYPMIVDSSSFAQGRGIDDFGYDEFVDADDATMSHEILFASGTTLLILFPDKKISIKKLT